MPTEEEFDPFGDAFFDDRLWRRSRKDKELRQRMIDSIEAAWQRDGERRCRVLEFLVGARPPDAFSYVVEALDDLDHSVRSTADIALHSYVAYGRKPDSAIIDRLVRRAENRALDGRDRNWALLILELCKADFTDWVEQFATDEPDGSIRSRARLARLGRGDTSQLSLLVQELADPDVAAWLAGAVWDNRNVAPLSPSDKALLRRVVQQQVNAQRRSHDEWYRKAGGGWYSYPNPAALVLLGWLVEGLNATSRDIGRAEEFIECRRRLLRGYRVRAVKTLAQLKHPAVAPTLRRLQRSRFAGVRRAATRALEKLGDVAVED